MRSTLLYLLLVGTPLLGLLAILTAGEQLVPPHAIGGSWMLQSSTGSACILTFAADGTAEMSVSQSGPHVEAIFQVPAGLRLSLELSNDSVTGGGTVPKTDACAGERLSLNGRLRISDSTTVIHGTLSRPECPRCTPVEFRATRSPQSEL